MSSAQKPKLPKQLTSPPPPKLLDRVRQVMRLQGRAKCLPLHLHLRVQDLDFACHTIMIYTHVLQRGGLAVRSPLDAVGPAGG